MWSNTRWVQYILAAAALSTQPLGAQRTIAGGGIATLTPVEQPGGPAIEGLQARATSPTDVALRWTCIQGPTGYQVLASMNGGPSVAVTPTPLSPNCVQDLTRVNSGSVLPGMTAATTYSTGFNHSGLAPGNNYTYVVRAVYPSGGPADSPPVTVRPLFPPPGYSVWAGSPGRVIVSWEWSRVNGVFATGHVVSRKLAGESAFRTLATLPYSQYNVFNDSGVPVGTHQYLVEAIDGMRGTPQTVTTGVLRLDGASTLNIVVVSLSWSGVWQDANVRVLSSPAATGPFTDITGDGTLYSGGWRGVAHLGTSLFYKVAVTYPSGIGYDAVAQVAIAPATDIGLVAEDGGGGTKLRWNCEVDVARYELMRRVGGKGPFVGVGGYAFTVYPKPGVLGGKPTCSYDDTTVPLGNNVEYVVIGFSSKDRGDKPIRAARTMTFIKTWP